MEPLDDSHANNRSLNNDYKLAPLFETERAGLLDQNNKIKKEINDLRELFIAQINMASEYINHKIIKLESEISKDKLVANKPRSFFDRIFGKNKNKEQIKNYRKLYHQITSLKKSLKNEKDDIVKVNGLAKKVIDKFESSHPTIFITYFKDLSQRRDQILENYDDYKESVYKVLDMHSDKLLDFAKDRTHPSSLKLLDKIGKLSEKALLLAKDPQKNIDFLNPLEEINIELAKIAICHEIVSLASAHEAANLTQAKVDHLSLDIGKKAQEGIPSNYAKRFKVELGFHLGNIEKFKKIIESELTPSKEVNLFVDTTMAVEILEKELFAISGHLEDIQQIRSNIEKNLKIIEKSAKNVKLWPWQKTLSSKYININNKLNKATSESDFRKFKDSLMQLQQEIQKDLKL
ncbi:MAG: hypothetical protein H0X29_06825 [Parachlamydiaceae bacterium]|nr:hypothetical protein [Parachlamydiaceae bacterium]